jgi:signal transduction histidine kinase
MLGPTERGLGSWRPTVEPTRSQTDVSAPPANILLVDDMPANLLSLEAVLGELGQNLIKAESGEQALRLILEHDFAVILLDVRMPGLDGIETAKLIRQRPRSRYTPIIFLTAYDNPNIAVVQAYATGAVDYLVKPFAAEVLRSKVRVFVELYQKTAQLERQAEQLREMQNKHFEMEIREKTLQEADRRKNAFVATLSHELRNPLAPLRNGLQVVRLRRADDPIVKQSCDMMERQVAKMTRLVDDLLDVSRIAQGKIQLRKEAVELATVVRHAVEACRYTIDTFGHKLTVRVPAEPIYLDADPTRLEQVLVNLLSNAAKYTERGGRISLGVERAGEQALIRVKDTGVGIPAEAQPRIFDLYMQIPDPLARSQSGLGIGLTLVRRLVELHGGKVEVFSEGLGKGSEFIVRLPAVPEPVVRASGPRPQLKSTAAMPRRILVVDDNRDAAETLGLLLQVQGHEVRTAHDGAAALAVLAESYLPDVVLLDISLPGMDGYEVARRLRQNPALDTVLLVALTGYGNEEVRSQAQQAGFDHYMVKPLDLDALHALLARRAQGGNGRASGAHPVACAPSSEASS